MSAKKGKRISSMYKNKNKKVSSKARTHKSKKTNKKKKQSLFDRFRFQLIVLLIISVVVLVAAPIYKHHQDNTLGSFHARPFTVVTPLAQPHAQPLGLLTPTSVRSIYNLSSTAGGSGTIAIVDSYDDPNIQSDLNTFDNQYGLLACTTANGCFTKVKINNNTPVDSTWAIEESLDVEWAHAIAPKAKILLVEAASANGTDLINAINNARSNNSVVAVSMSWGGSEFSSETAYENYFTSNYGANFFAASGDSGHGTSWPAVSANVIGVGGTTVTLNSKGAVASEVAWSGSGGGLSSFIKEPTWQKTVNLPLTNGMRATPDVAYNANPNTGYPVYDSVPYSGYAGWFEVGGTSAGTPQWAAISTISNRTLSAAELYRDSTRVPQSTFRQITSGSNGTCAYYCTARVGYNYVTGLGVPLTTSF